MDFIEYQNKAITTAIYNKKLKIIYPTLGLSGESGEVSNKIKKIYRDKSGEFNSIDCKIIADELGDVLWYISQLAYDLNISLDYIATHNIEKLEKRKSENSLGGSGDNR